MELGQQRAMQRRAMGVPRAFQFRAVLLLGAVIALFREVGGSPGLVGAKAVRVPNLALRGGRPVTRFDENAKAVDIIMRDRLSKTARPTTETEETVAEALWRGSKSHDELRMMKYMHINEVRVVDPQEKGVQRALVLMVPFAELTEYRKIQQFLISYLEKELRTTVFVVGARRILPKERTGHRLLKQKRPRSRTIAAVHAAYLEDILWPHDIVGQHQVFQVGQSKPLHRIFLDPAVQAETHSRLPVLANVYRAMTGKRTEIDYLVYASGSEFEKQRTPNRMPADDAGFLAMPPAALEVPPAPLLRPTRRGRAVGLPPVHGDKEEEETPAEVPAEAA